MIVGDKKEQGTYISSALFTSLIMTMSDADTCAR